MEDDDAIYISYVKVYEPQANELPIKHPKLFSKVALLLKEKQKFNDERASSPPETKEIKWYNQANFSYELEDDLFYIWKDTTDYLLQQLLVMYYANQIQ